MEKQLISEEVRKKIEGYYKTEEEKIYENGKLVKRIERKVFVEPVADFCIELYKKHQLI